MKRIVSALGLGLVLAVGGCQSGEKCPEVDLNAKVDCVNKVCVIQQDEGVQGGPRVEWNGQKVGFCCAGCVRKWNAMSEADKDKALASAIAKSK